MSHQITLSDSLILAEKRGWHGLGTVLPQAPSLVEAFPISGLGWQVDKVPVKLEDSGELVPGAFCNRRSDNGELLGMVGDKYRVFQNSELFGLAQAITEDGAAEVETCGSLRGGRDVFLLVRNDSFELGRNGDDQVQTFSLIHNTHDGSSSLRVLGTSVRVVCANTLAYAMGGKSAKAGISIRHTESMLARVAEAQDALFQSRAGAYEFQAKAEALAARSMRQHELQAFFVEVYQRGHGYAIPQRSAIKTKKDQRQFDRAVRTIADWQDRLEQPRQTLDGIEGTAWAALNAVTEWSDHERTVRRGQSVTESEARQHSNLMGSSSDFKTQAFERALELVG